MAEMERFLAWLNDTNKAPELADRLVQAAVAHLWFEAIHPFEDGNGRIGRAISEWVIAQDGHSPLRLMSVSQQLLIKRKAYYAGLQSMVKPVHWDNQGEAAIDLTDWANWFLGCIAGACDASFDHMQGAAHKTRFWQAVMLKLPELSPAQRKVLNTVFDAQPDGFKGGLSTQLYAKIAKLSRATAYRDLTLLCDAGVLLRSGTGRGTRYHIYKDTK